MKQPKLNLKLLRKVRDRIAEIPESYDQSWWAIKSDDAPCGTTACLAGEAIICAAPKPQTGLKTLWRIENYGDPSKRAQSLLGLSSRDAMLMFAGGASGWPQPYRSRFQRATRQATKAKIAVAYLDECLRRKAVTW